ncbi:putative transcriptional regulatory protein pdtaR [subsurface metagenome]
MYELILEKSPNILIVEDENVIAMDIQFMLENLGYKISGVVSSGEDSIKKASSMLPDLILMDIKLKGKIDGVSAANQIYKSLRIPVVYLTAYSYNTTMDRAKETMHFGFISKPFGEKELQNIIEETLAHNKKYKHNN